MNKKIIIGIVAVLIIIVLFLIMNTTNTTTVTNPTVNQPQINTTTATSTSLLMQSSGAQFSQYKYFSKAHEIFPTLAADTKKALGAFSYNKESLGNNLYKFTLTNNAEGYKGQSVIVSGDQFVYFIEPALGDDSASEDSVTTDDILMAVDAQGNILK